MKTHLHNKLKILKLSKKLYPSKVAAIAISKLWCNLTGYCKIFAKEDKLKITKRTKFLLTKKHDN